MRLEAAAVRYLIAGGLAENAHGYLRFTKDVDLVIELEPDNLRVALTALGRLGYRPAVPMPLAQFADPVRRESWVRDFGQEYDRALVKPLREGLPVRFVSIPTLIRMKELAGRPQDLIDIEHLHMRQLDHE